MIATTFLASVRRPSTVLATAALPLALMAGACSTGDADTTQAQKVTIADQWVKSAETGMTAAFGTIENTSGTGVTLTGGTADAAGRVEVHEMAPAGGGMVMRPVEGGLDIGPDETVTLEPGGAHLMLMDLRRPIRAGDTESLTMRFADGSTREVEAQARDFQGAREHYAPGHGSPASDGSDG